jgi:hypothetical protein
MFSRCAEQTIEPICRVSQLHVAESQFMEKNVAFAFILTGWVRQECTTLQFMYSRICRHNIALFSAPTADYFM